MKETIQHAAIKRSDGIISTGKTHANVIHSSPYGTCKAGSEQGFVTSFGRFVLRPEAAFIAWYSEQIPNAHYELINHIGLTSENLWDYCGFGYQQDYGYLKKVSCQNCETFGHLLPWKECRDIPCSGFKNWEPLTVRTMIAAYDQFVIKEGAK